MSFQNLEICFVHVVATLQSIFNAILKCTLYSVVFPAIENVNGEYEFDISELLADHVVTGVDLIMTLSTNNSCRFVWAGNDISKKFDLLYCQQMT